MADVAANAKPLPPYYFAERFERLDRVNELPTTTATEQALLLAAVRWVNDDGELSPSIATWAKLARIDYRTAQRMLRSFENRGIVQVVERSKGGRRMNTREKVARGITSTFRIPALARYPGPTPGLPLAEPRHSQPETPAARGVNPGIHDEKPRPHAGRTTGEQSMQQPTTANGVVAALSPELQRHPNLTPERRAWIERVAPTKEYPLGWAEANILGGWDLPKPPAAGSGETKEQRAKWLTTFDALAADQKPALLEKARQRCRGLARQGDDNAGLRTEAGKIHDEETRNGTLSPNNGGARL